ncbi:hypothetical protein N7481_002146 [Penicillium waksmanii]|uniref:uncharacterized protein n=1 Tax=Penicillium waksmanii TaxID=69791 RepID=UPI0025493CF7|nr:uncharacterized protein N7481_002146 [Penicillium waksmanii]KAJ5995169.1 hypothetical protein N7481_002146 [Penicillium waksmanii]
MENFKDLLNHPVTTYLKSSTSTALTTHLATLRSTIIDPYIISPLSSILMSTTGTTDLFTIFILLAIFYVSLRLLDYARRVIMWWVVFALRLVFWGSIALSVLYVYQVGFEKAGKDLGWVYGVVEGFVEDFQARAAQAAENGKGGGRAAGGGYRDVPGWDGKGKVTSGGGWGWGR